MLTMLSHYSVTHAKRVLNREFSTSNSYVTYCINTPLENGRSIFDNFLKTAIAPKYRKFVLMYLSGYKLVTVDGKPTYIRLTEAENQDLLKQIYNPANPTEFLRLESLLKK